MKNIILLFCLVCSLLSNGQTIVVDQITVETTDFSIKNVSDKVKDYIKNVIDIKSDSDFLTIQYHILDSLSMSENRQVYVVGVEQYNSFLELSEIGIYGTLVYDGKNQGGFDLYMKGNYYWMDNLDQASIIHDSILYSSNLSTKKYLSYRLTSHLYKYEVPSLLNLKTTNRLLPIDKTIYNKTLSPILIVRNSQMDTLFYLNTYKIGDDTFYLLLDRKEINNGDLQIVQVRNNEVVESVKVGELICKDGIIIYYERPEIFYQEEEVLSIKVYDSMNRFREIDYKRN